MIQTRRIYVIGAITLCIFLLVLSSTSLRNNRRLRAAVKQFTDYGDSTNRIVAANESAPSTTEAKDGVDWSQYAYVQYATNTPYLCNSVMLFERLHSLNCKADRLLMYPSDFSPDGDNTEGQLLRKARDAYKVILKPIEVQRRQGHDRKLIISSGLKEYQG